MQNTTTQPTATAKQIAFLASLTGKPSESFAALTIRAASVLIGEALKEQRANKRGAIAHKKAHTTTKPTATAEGVKVGDVFSMSWGYDCTINNSFEVVEIVSAHTVKVRELAHTPGDAYSPVSGTEYLKRGDYLERSFWARNGSQPLPGADATDENLFTKQIRKSKWGRGEEALYIAFGYKGNYHAYLDKDPERKRYCSEY